MMDSKHLEALVEKVARKVNPDSPPIRMVSFTFGIHETVYANTSAFEYGWVCEVKALVEKRKHNKIVTVRPAIYTYAHESPDIAAEEAIRQIHLFQHPEEKDAQERRMSIVQLLTEMHAQGDLTDEQFAESLAKIEKHVKASK